MELCHFCRAVESTILSKFSLPVTVDVVGVLVVVPVVSVVLVVVVVADGIVVISVVAAGDIVVIPVVVVDGVMAATVVSAVVRYAVAVLGREIKRCKKIGISFSKNVALFSSRTISAV